MQQVVEKQLTNISSSVFSITKHVVTKRFGNYKNVQTI